MEVRPPRNLGLGSHALLHAPRVAAPARRPSTDNLSHVLASAMPGTTVVVMATDNAKPKA